MGPNVHPSVTFYAGDDWPIRGYLHTAEGTPLDLSSAESPSVEWKLIDSSGTVVKTMALGSGITILGDPRLGEVSIKYPKADTASVSPATYHDQCRAETVSQGKSVQWVGEIVVKAAA